MSAQGNEEQILLPTIGSRSHINLVASQIDDIPAKVDTGADSSSIWATNVREENGILYFSLFGPGSKFYTGEILETEEYKQAEIRNSFGHSELRYKVKLTTVIKGKKIKIEYSLADRSRNRYPILIGKRTLAGKFLVDVSHSDGIINSEAERSVLIITARQKRLMQKLATEMTEVEPNLTCHHLTYDDIILNLEQGRIEAIDATTGKPLNTYDLIYFKSHKEYQELAYALSEYCKYVNLKFIDSEVGDICSNTKVSQYAKLARHNFSIPKTMVFTAKSTANHYSAIVEVFGTPFVLKDPAADNGKSNYLVSTEKDFQKIILDTPTSQKYFAAQEYIKNDGDYRIVAFKNRVELVIMRHRTNKKSHVNSISQGNHATLEPDDIDDEKKIMAIEAAKLMGRQVAGIDLIEDKATKKWYILEVNSSPQLASGAFIEDKAEALARFIYQEAKK